jgi:predicted porin
MKKSLFAVAAVTAFAGAAQAQSSVTIYGILDVGYAGANYRTQGATSVTKTTTSRMGDNGQTTSRLGFRGTEDLGGGMSAFFTIETAVDVNGSTGVFSSAGTGNRQTFLGIKKNGIGAASIGTQYTVIHNAVAATDPGGANNQMGDLIYDKQGTATAAAASGQANNSSYTVRTNNMLFAKSANFSGFEASAFYTQKNSNTNQTTTTASGITTVTGGSTNNTGWGIGANYTGVKNLFLTANYQEMGDKNPYGTLSYTTTGVAGNAVTTTAVTAGNYAAGGVGGSAAAGTNDKDAQQYYAATYDFGIFKAYAQYVARKVTDNNNSTNYTNRTAQQLGVTSFITPKIQVWGMAGSGKYQAATATWSPTANLTGFQLGTSYILSKRTNLYAIYGQQSTSNVRASATTGNISYGGNSYAAGVRHTF